MPSFDELQEKGVCIDRFGLYANHFSEQTAITILEVALFTRYWVKAYVICSTIVE